MAQSGSGARRYAEALLDLATGERAVPQYRRSLEQLASVFRADVVRSLRDPRTPLERRRRALDAATKEEPRAIRAVLDILLERDRIALVPDIARAFSDLVDRREGIVHAKVTTSVELNERERASEQLDLRGKETASTTLDHARFSDLAGRGWRSGNTHLHLKSLTRPQADEYLRTIPCADGLDRARRSSPPQCSSCGPGRSRRDRRGRTSASVARAGPDVVRRPVDVPEMPRFDPRTA